MGGRTGSGKTSILHELRLLGEQVCSKARNQQIQAIAEPTYSLSRDKKVLDIESEARHMGSAFGHIPQGFGQQPSQQEFENSLAEQWLAFDPDLPVYMEDESRSCGQRLLPEHLFRAKENTRFYVELDEVRSER